MTIFASVDNRWFQLPGRLVNRFFQCILFYFSYLLVHFFEVEWNFCSNDRTKHSCFWGIIFSSKPMFKSLERIFVHFSKNPLKNIKDLERKLKISKKSRKNLEKIWKIIWDAKNLKNPKNPSYTFREVIYTSSETFSQYPLLTAPLGPLPTWKFYHLIFPIWISNKK